jgi:DNA-binding transcriptional regulator YiaG
MTPQELQTLRRRLGLTQAGLAGMLGVTPSTVARWEQGARKISGLAAYALTRLARERGPTRSRKAS